MGGEGKLVQMRNSWKNCSKYFGKLLGVDKSRFSNSNSRKTFLKKILKISCEAGKVLREKQEFNLY